MRYGSLVASLIVNSISVILTLLCLLAPWFTGTSPTSSFYMRYYIIGGIKYTYNTENGEAAAAEAVLSISMLCMILSMSMGVARLYYKGGAHSCVKNCASSVVPNTFAFFFVNVGTTLGLIAARIHVDQIPSALIPNNFMVHFSTAYYASCVLLITALVALICDASSHTCCRCSGCCRGDLEDSFQYQAAPDKPQAASSFNTVIVHDEAATFSVTSATYGTAK